MLRSLGKQLRRFARQGQTAKEGRMEKREASFASIQQELINLANSTPPYGAKVDSKMLVALSSVNYPGLKAGVSRFNAGCPRRLRLFRS
jgi:hypothetical protein